MNYQSLYDNLISFRLQNPPSKGVYTERHHIIPKSMGGSDDPANLVVLTGREHWVAHLLLWKIDKNPSMAHACHMMAMKCEERGIPQVRNSRMYEKIRKICAEKTGERNKITQRGSGNSQYGTCWICNIELQENKKITKCGSIPEGWILGRNKWNALGKITKKKKLKQPRMKKSRRKYSDDEIIKRRQDRNMEFHRINSEIYKTLWKDFINSPHTSLNKFAKLKGIKRQTLMNNLKKYVDTYPKHNSTKPLKNILFI